MPDDFVNVPVNIAATGYDEMRFIHLCNLPHDFPDPAFDYFQFGTYGECGERVL